MNTQPVTLLRDCLATVIPAGEKVTLSKGAEYVVAQALGGSVTLRDSSGMYRVGSEDLDALGEEVKAVVEVAEKVEDGNGPFDEERVWTALRGCFDPEIPVNIVDLGLIYDLQIDEIEDNLNRVEIKMTLTAQGCGMGPVIADDARTRIERLPGVESAQVDIVWDPTWNPRMISEKGKSVLGLE